MLDADICKDVKHFYTLRLSGQQKKVLQEAGLE
jgi:hypothetical protein